MSNENNDIYTFYSLISQYYIEIPVIQRDYAQGRNTPKAQAVRRNMINSMMKALLSDLPKDQLFFDFVYGKVKDVSKDKVVFYPFDGQQRLTALFLFHLYFFQRFDSSKCEILKKFSYATRKSSVEFCLKLVKENIIPDTPGILISEFIKNASWFYMDWEKDPTVLSMLSMLDEIHNQFDSHKDDIKPEKLISKLLDPNTIRFHFIDMKKKELTDEIYIKMNSRGKHLTGFENLKAYLEKYLKENLPDLEQRFVGYYDKQNKKQTGIDGVWSDNFFKLKKALSKNNNEQKKDEEQRDLLPDSLIHSIINRYFLNVWYIWFATTDFATDEIDTVNLMNERIKKEFFQYPDNETFVSWDLYEFILEHCNGEKVLTALFNFFDSMESNIDEIKINSQAIWNRKTLAWNLFLGDIKNGNEEYASRIAFYAVVKYFENNTFNATKFGDWLRVVWNILENSRNDDFDNYNSALILINGLAIGDSDINKILGTQFDTLHLNRFAKEQVSEEKLKSLKISGSDGEKWKNNIEEAEKDENLYGRISILFSDGENTTREQYQERFKLFNSIMNHPDDEFHFVKVLLSHYKEENVNNHIFFCQDSKRHIRNWKKELLTSRLSQCFYDLENDEIIENSQPWINQLTKSKILGAKTRPNKNDKHSKIIHQEGANIVFWGTTGCAWRNYGNEIDGNVILNNSRNYLLKGIPGLTSKSFVEDTGYVKNFHVKFIYDKIHFIWWMNDNIIYINEEDDFPEREHEENQEGLTDFEIYYCFDASQISTSDELKEELDKLVKEYKEK